MRAGLSLLRNTLSRVPAWPLAVALAMMLFFLPKPAWHGDLYYFREMPDTLRHPYYARWIFALLGRLSEPAAFVLLSLTCMGLFYAAARIWKAPVWMVFLSFPYAWTLIYGQIDGLVVGGLALAWLCMERRWYVLGGAGLLLASIKPQMAVPLILAIWWWSGRAGRIKLLILPAIVVGLSFLQWGFWIPQWFQGLFSTDDLRELSRNLSFWPQTGPWILLLWIPVAWLPLPRRIKLIAIAAATMLSVPYFPFPSAVLALVMPVPVWAWAAMQAPVIFTALGAFWIYPWLKLIPLALLVWCALQSTPVLKALGLRSRRAAG